MTTYQPSINPCGDIGRPDSASWTTRLGKVLATWSERAARRQELEHLLDVPEHLLKDMGITREEVYREYRKPFWRA